MLPEKRPWFFIFTPMPVNTGIIHLGNEVKQESNLYHTWTTLLSKAWLLEIGSYRKFYQIKWVEENDRNGWGFLNVAGFV